MPSVQIEFEKVPSEETVVNLLGGRAWYMLVDGKMLKRSELNEAESLFFKAAPNDDYVMVYSREGVEGVLIEYTLRQAWGERCKASVLHRDISRAAVLIIDVAFTEAHFRKRVLPNFTIAAYPVDMPTTTREMIEGLTPYVENGEVQTMGFALCECCAGIPAHGHIVDHGGNYTPYAFDTLERMLCENERVLRTHRQNPRLTQRYRNMFLCLSLEAVRSAVCAGLPSQRAMFFGLLDLKRSRAYLDAVKGYYCSWLAAGAGFSRFPVYTLCVKPLPERYAQQEGSPHFEP